MKRLFLMSFCFLLLVGCKAKSSSGGKVLECNSSKTIGNALSNQNYKIVFNGEKVSNFSLTIDVSLDEIDDVTRDNLENDVNSAFADYRNRKGVSYASNIKDNGFTVKIHINYSELNENDKNSLNIINSENSYEEIKNELESNDFLCN